MSLLQLPQHAPSQITRGETEIWTTRVVDYPAADGWTLTHYFRGTGAGLDVEADVEDGLYKSTISAVQSAELAEGRYDWQAWVSKGSEEDEDLERHQVSDGVALVKAGFPALDAEDVYDGRSDTKKALDAIRAKLADVATADQLSYVIGDRQVQRYSRNELIEVEKLFSRLYNQEVRKERMRRGGSFFQNVNVRFTEPK